jgi:DnaJ-class molecular chaperone
MPGDGGLGPFGPVKKSDFHYKRPCNTCNGRGRTSRQIQCPKCDGKGGLGPFGAADVLDIHKKRDCPVCVGRGYNRRNFTRCNSCEGTWSWRLRT